MNPETNETQIRRLLGDWAQALRAKDAEKASAFYKPGVLTFDLAPPLQNKGIVTFRGNLVAWFETWSGPIGCELHELSVTAGEDVAFGHCLEHLTGAKADGENVDLWFRATFCLVKAGGEWRIAHEHSSAPFYMEPPFKAALDLKM